MGLDGTQCAWANQPHLAVCPLSPTPRAPDVLPGIFPGRASLFLDLVPPIPLWGQREHVSPRPPPPTPRGSHKCWKSSCVFTATQTSSVRVIARVPRACHMHWPGHSATGGQSARLFQL